MDSWKLAQNVKYWEFNPQKKIDGMDAFMHRMATSKNPTYYDPWLGIDYNRSDLLGKNNKIKERAMWSYAEGEIMQPTVLPTYLNEQFAYALPVDAPAYAAIPRKASMGATIEYVRITAFGAPSYWVADTATPDYVAPTTARVTLRKRICETWGGVTGFVEASGRGWSDMLAKAHDERLKALLSQALEDSCLNGAGTGLAAKGFLTYQGTTNGVDVGGDGTEVTLDDIRAAIKKAYDAGGDLESFGFAITDPRTYNFVKSLVTEYIGYINIPLYDLPWGIKTYAIDGMPFIKSRKMPPDANGKKILMLDRRYSYAAILQDITTELYGKTKDAIEFAIKWYGNFVNEVPEYSAIVYGCA